ncbi:response regulator transcription factor [Larkinella ripae]
MADQIQKSENYEVVLIGRNGRDLIRYLSRNTCPDVVLLGVLMPEMDGYETVTYLQKHCPTVRVLALSTMDRRENMIRMLRNGAQGYLPKTCSATELHQALDELCTKGYSYAGVMTNQLIRNLNPTGNRLPSEYWTFSNREQTFLKMACSDLTYAEIADRMCVSARTVDGYREAIFQKMQVKSRVGMALEAVRWGLVQL